MGDHCPICKKDWLECDCPYVDGLQAPLVDWDNGHLVLVARGATFCTVRELYVSHEKLRAKLAAANAVVEVGRKVHDDRLQLAILKYDKLQGGS